MRTMLKPVFAVAAIVCHGQVREFPERGTVPTGSYSVSEIEAISNTTGNLSLSIPLAQLPTGPAKGMASIRLNYNSSLFNMKPEQSGDGPLPVRRVVPSEEGGWSYSFWYGIRMIDRTPTSTTCSPQHVEAFYPTKLVLLMPDGGTKELNRRGEADQPDGYHEINANGRKSTCSGYGLASGIPGIMRYYTTDGSYLRLDLRADGGPVSGGGGTYYTNQTWTLQFPDGSTAEGKGETTTKITDRNGRSVTFNSTLDMTSSTWTGNLTIQEEGQPASRSISMSLNGLSGTDTINWPGFGAELEAKVSWGYVDSGAVDYTCDSNNSSPAPPQCQLTGSRRVVTSITIPKATVADPDYKYLFDYRDTANCGVVQCYGELGTITLPGQGDALSVNYEYTRENTIIDPDFLDSAVKKKIVSFKEKTTGSTAGVDRTETTNYTFSNDHSIISQVETGATTHRFQNPRVMSDPYRGLVHRTENPDGSRVDRIWKRNLTDSTALPDPGNPYVSIEASTIPNSSGAATRTAQRETKIDVNGNPREVVEYDWVNYTAVPGYNATKITGLGTGSTAKRKTVTTYHNAAALVVDGQNASATASSGYYHTLSPRHFRAPKRAETQNGSGTVFAATEFDFDIATTTANLTEERRWDSEIGVVSTPLVIPDPDEEVIGNAIRTSTTYTCSGLPQTVTDPNGFVTRHTYDGNCQRTQEELAFGRTEKRTTTFTYDSSYSGLMTGSTDSDNGSTTTFGYDKLGRRTLTTEASGTTTDERKTEVTFDDQKRRVITKRDKATAGDLALVTVQHFDSRGINWLTQQIEGSSVPPNTDFTSGILTEHRMRRSGGFTYEAESLPYHDTGTDPKGWTVRKMDAGGRLKFVTHYSGATGPEPWDTNASSMGETSTVYNGEVVTTTAPENKTAALTRDALGRVTGADAGGLSSTVNTYDPLDNLVTVVQGTQTRTFNYSSLSRLTSSTQPENGTTLYTYDNNGNLLSRQDARGAATGKSEFLAPAGSAATEKAYDGLGRPRRKQIRELGAVKDVTWTWDTATNGKGRLASVAFGGTTVSYTGYDKLGRVKNHKQTTDAIEYPFSYTYFRNDEVASITYPSAKVMTYTLDNAGRPSSGLTVAKTYVTSASYAPHGAVDQMTFGTGKLKLSNTFNNKLQTTLIKTEKISPATVLQQLEYDYHVTATTENNGNPRKHRIVEPSVTRTQEFSFDAANRLTQMKEGLGTGTLLNQSYGFDAFGNRWVTSTTGSIAAPSYTPQAAGAFDTATNRFAAAVMLNSFDAAGHTIVTDENARTVEWDSEGRVVKTTWASYAPTFYSFDGLGQRVKKANASWGQSVVVYDAFGRKAAEYGAGFDGRDCTTCYPVTDTVGALRLVANENGDAVRRFDWTGQGPGIHDYNTFANGRTGIQWSPTTVVNVQWAGGYQRANLPLEPNAEFSGTRTMKRHHGRFWSPDENLVDQSPDDPLSWNLYAYARGNPVRYSDPTGMKCAPNGIDDETGEACFVVDVDGKLPSGPNEDPFGRRPFRPSEIGMGFGKGVLNWWIFAYNTLGEASDAVDGIPNYTSHRMPNLETANANENRGELISMFIFPKLKKIKGRQPKPTVKVAPPASERTALRFARQIEDDLGPDARTVFHNLKDGRMDRTLEELKEHAQLVYDQHGKTPPGWMK